MAKTARKNTASTQKFIEILDIVEDIVIIAGGNACLVIEVKATNFALLSADEQDAKIFSYASLLNSLSFAVQILIRSKRIDISSYLNLLVDEQKKTQNQALAKQIGLYRDFVQELVKVNTILDKRFYVVIPYSSLEKGITGAKDAAGISTSQDNFFIGARSALHSKAESLHAQLGRLNLKAETLNKEQLTKLFYDIFNDNSISANQDAEHVTKPIILGKGAK